jgi:hypothetical protein
MIYFLSFLKENLDKLQSDVQKEVPIKSSKSLLYEYWNVFFYLYSKKILEKFKKDNSESIDPNLLNSVSMNNLFEDNAKNFCQKKEKDNSKETIELNNNISLNNLNIYNNPINLPSPNNIKSSLFQPKNNIGLGNNYIYPGFAGIIPNSQNDLFLNQIQRINSISNNLNVNSFFNPPKILPNTFGNDIRPNIFGDMDNINNIDQTNVPFFQIPMQNPISLTPLTNPILSGNNIITSGIPNNFMITNNNTNINSNSNININKNINNIIKVDNINNNSININTNQNSNTNNLTNDNKNIINNYLENENNKIIIEKDSNEKEKNKVKINLQTHDETNDNSNKNNIAAKTTKSDNEPILKKPALLFNVKETSLIEEEKLKQKGKITSKKRKRFLKNNKLVFIQSDKGKDYEEKNNKNELEEYEENENEASFDSEKVSELIQKNTKPRGSKYRGVSKNGSQWQVLIMVKKKKRYIGSFSNEEEAAKAYDKVALQHHGIKAKTNYDYTKEEVEKIMAGPKVLKFE